MSHRGTCLWPAQASSRPLSLPLCCRALLCQAAVHLLSLCRLRVRSQRVLARGHQMRTSWLCKTLSTLTWRCLRWGTAMHSKSAHETGSPRRARMRTCAHVHHSPSGWRQLGLYLDADMCMEHRLACVNGCTDSFHSHCKHVHACVQERWHWRMRTAWQRAAGRTAADWARQMLPAS